MDGNMRRLPPWMIAGASSDVTTSSNRTECKTVEAKRKREPEATKTKAEKRQRRTVKPKEKDESEKPKKAEKRRKIEGEAKRSGSNGDVKNTEIVKSVTDSHEEDLTVDDLLSFAKEYVESEEQERKKLLSGSMVVQEETNETRDDMLDLLLGPFFKKS